MSKEVYRCWKCDSTFELGQAPVEWEMADDMYDRPLCRVYHRVCPFCGDEGIAPDSEFENEGRLNDRAFNGDRDEENS